ncbi:uncharacterized protein LOC129588289 [Paramacrobiotus metropolitanus]|uniref:uncharacterized protein LOC129588289 n=1 Tax=Paramacrobiotus metropolitanus TaxID=2943436 RepID=UPI002445A388|nr:uncharacterized protein LOC129588289 [Paramacrobiotus metropolitanus]
MITIFISGGVFNIAINAGPWIWKLAFTKSSNILLRILPDIPFTFINIRCLFVLFVYWKYADYWSYAKRCAEEMVLHCSNHNNLQQNLKNLRCVSIVLGVSAFALVTIFETLDLLHFAQQDPRRLNATFDNPLEPFPLRITVWLNEFLWIIFCALPFALSQQVYISLILLALLLRLSLTDVNKNLKDINASLGIVPELGSRRQSDDLYEHTTLFNQLTSLKTRYLSSLKLCHGLNEAYGSIIFVIYGMDLFTICGFISATVADGEGFLLAYVLNFFTIAIFAAYIGLMIPMVKVYEESVAINFLLHEIMDKCQVQQVNRT